MAALIVAALLAGIGWRRARHHQRTSRRSACVPRSRYRALVAVVLVLGCQMAIGAPPAFADDCGQAPNPESPGSGLVGSIDPPHPATPTDADPYDRYALYGYAGMVWHTYQADCGPLAPLTDPTSGMDTDTGNFLFNGAKMIVGTTNGLDRAVTDSSLMGPIYKAVQTGANRVYSNVFLQLLALCALLLSLVLLRAAWRGDLAAVSRRTLTMLGGLWLAASSLVLLRYLEPVDKAIVGFSTDIQAGFTPDASGSTSRDQFARDLHEQIIYTTWLRGEFGAPTVPQAAQYGHPLLDAQAFTVAEHDRHDDTNQAVIDGKKHEYTDIAGKLGASTDTFTGDAGGRAGAGLLALLQAVAYALFPLLAKLTVLLAQVIFRLIIITSPLLGLAALLHPDVLRTLAKVAATVLFNLLVVSVLAGTHTLILQAVFNGGFPVSVQILIAGIVTGILFGVARPLRRLRQTLQAPTHALSGHLPRIRSGFFGKLRAGAQISSQYKQFLDKVREDENKAAVAADSPDRHAARPELTNSALIVLPGVPGEEFSHNALRHSDRDPLRRHGPARETHPQEWLDSLNYAEQQGVEVHVRPGVMAYGPAPSPGDPGRLYIDPDASIGALRHEFQHLLDDQAQGWGGLRQMEDVVHAFNMEQRAYEREIEYAESIGDHESAELLKGMIEEERKKWLGGN